MSRGEFMRAGGRDVLLSWWRGLERDKGGRAALRRCHTLSEVMLEPSYHALCRELHALPEVKWDLERLAAVAALAALVEEWPEGIESLPTQMARKVGDRKVVSELRFRRVLQCQEPEELFQSLRRIIRLLDKRVDLPDLVAAVHDWGDRTRKEWAYAYFKS